MNKKISFELLKNYLCNFYDVLVPELLSKDRHKHIVECRRMIAYIAKEHLNKSYPFIAYKLKRDHSTIFDHCAFIRNRLPIDKELRETIAMFLQDLERLA